MLVDEPCDACLRGEAPKCGPSGSLPTTEGLVFVDIYHTQVPTLWKRERTVVGMTHAATRLRRTWRVASKDQAPEAISLGLAFFNSVGRPIRHIHTDGAGELKGSGVVPLAQQHSIRITTTLVSTSRQNAQEPGWRAINATVRVELAQSRMPLDFWGWCWDHVEEGQSLKPSRSPPHDCALGRFLGEKPPGSHRRPFGCLCYPTVAPRLPSGTLVNKMAVQAPRALHLGYVGNRTGSFEQIGTSRCQPGYACYIPSDDSSVGKKRAGTIIITDSVRFVPDCFPGLERCAGGGGGWSIPTSRIPFIARGIDHAEEQNQVDEPAAKHASGPLGAPARHRAACDTPQRTLSSPSPPALQEDETTRESPPGIDADRTPPSTTSPASDGLVDVTDEEQLDLGEFDYTALDLARGFAPVEPIAEPDVLRRGGNDDHDDASARPEPARSPPVNLQSFTSFPPSTGPITRATSTTGAVGKSKWLNAEENGPSALSPRLRTREATGLQTSGDLPLP